jgi:hypothetical protein
MMARTYIRLGPGGRSKLFLTYGSPINTAEAKVAAGFKIYGPILRAARTMQEKRCPKGTLLTYLAIVGFT